MEPFRELAELDRLVHEPARLAILTVLLNCASADFLFLERVTGVTKGNLSAHLAKLADAQYIEITKSFVGKVPRTTVALTEPGRAAITVYWQQLEALRSATQTWRPAEET